MKDTSVAELLARVDRRDADHTVTLVALHSATDLDWRDDITTWMLWWFEHLKERGQRCIVMRLFVLAWLVGCDGGSRAIESLPGPAPAAVHDAAHEPSRAEPTAPGDGVPTVSLVELARAEELWAYRLESEWVLVRGIGNRFYVSRRAGEAWVDEEALSSGLPARVQGKALESRALVSCNRVALVAGKLPERASLVIDIGGASFACSSARGTYEAYRYNGTSWRRDRQHRAVADSGIFLNLDLGAGVVGWAEHDLVEGPLGITGLMYTWRGDPWRRRRALPFVGPAVLACGDGNGVVYLANSKTLYRVTKNDATAIGDLPPFRPNADCVATNTELYTLDENNALLVVDLATGKSHIEPTRFSEHTSFVRAGNRLVVLEDTRGEYVHTADLGASPLTFTKRRIDTKRVATVSLLGVDGNDLWLHIDPNATDSDHLDEVIARLAL